MYQEYHLAASNPPLGAISPLKFATLEDSGDLIRHAFAIIASLNWRGVDTASPTATAMIKGVSVLNECERCRELPVRPGSIFQA